MFSDIYEVLHYKPLQVQKANQLIFFNKKCDCTTVLILINKYSVWSKQLFPVNFVKERSGNESKGYKIFAPLFISIVNLSQKEGADV